MLTKTFIAKQKRKIEEKIVALEKEIVAGTKFENLGSDDDDNAQEFEEFEEKIAIGKNLRVEIENLKAALKRIKEGTYGKCKKCGGMIEKSRLEVYPEAEYCATHAKN